MAIVDNITVRPKVVNTAKGRVEDARYDVEALPRHLLMGTTYRSGPTKDEVHIHFHTAGSSVIWALNVNDVASSPRLLAGLTSFDAFTIGSALGYERSRRFFSI